MISLLFDLQSSNTEQDSTADSTRTAAEKVAARCVKGTSVPFDICSTLNLIGILRAGCLTGLYIDNPVMVHRLDDQEV